MKSFLAQFCIIVGLMMLTFFVIDQINSAMGFINNSMTKILLAVFSICAMALGIITIIDKYKQK